MRNAPFPLLALVVLAAVAPALPAEAASEANTPKIKYIRVRQNQNVAGVTGPAGTLPASADGRSWVLEVVTTGGVDPQARVIIGSEGSRVRTLRHGSTQQRASVSAFLGDTSVKGTSFALELTSADRGSSFSGRAYVAPGRSTGVVTGFFKGAKGGEFGVSSVSIFVRNKAGEFSVAFDVEGPGAGSVTAGTLGTETLNADGKPVVGVTAFDASDLTLTRTFVAPVGFDGDPVGSVHAIDIRVDDPTTRVPTSEKALLEMIELPGEGGAPGPILGVTQGGYGNGYRPQTGQTQQAQLL